MPKTNQPIMQQVRENPLPWVVQVVVVVSIFGNLWIASKLAPLAVDLAVQKTEVRAMVDNHNDLRGDFEEHVTTTLEVLQEIKDTLNETQTDTALIRQRVNNLPCDSCTLIP